MEKLKNCKQEGCKIHEDGKCLEGLENDECPHFYWDEGKEDNIEEHEGASKNTSLNNKSGFPLFSGAELTLDQAGIITHKYNCSWVVILGEYDCGKTTLLSSVFDLFQIGFFKNYSFAGSLTQIGFEERSHLSRVISGNETPDTERTKATGFKLLHLALRKIDSTSIKHFILSDISGETIRQARNSGRIMQSQLSMVKNVDYIFYMIDGDKLKQESKTSTLLNVNLFLETALKNAILTRKSTLNILISKWDILFNDNSFDIDRDLIVPLNSRFANRLEQINFLRIASRPDESDKGINIGYGLEEILDIIHTGNPQVLPTVELKQFVSTRNFENLKIKVNE